MLPYLTPHQTFPDPRDALDEPNGLLAAGADLSVDTLLRAYRSGIFPWYSEYEPILWWSPSPRGVLMVGDFKPSKSLRKFIRNTAFKLSKNLAFDQVVLHCASVPRGGDGTWITSEMIEAYCQLHRAGFAHSIEVWDGSALVGGLYGVSVGQMFCGESMFHKATNASKFAFYGLNQLLSQHGVKMIDCQMQNSHLETLGVKEMPRSIFLSQLAVLREHEPMEGCWRPGYF